MTQREAVINRMRLGDLSQLQATHELGATRLSAIVFDLRKQGYQISTVYRVVSNRYGTRRRVAFYRLIEEGA